MPECFIIMPMSAPDHMLSTYGGDVDHFQHVLDHLFVPAIEKAGLQPVAPRAEASVVIHADIIRKIETCGLVLCDMSALNPNVFFELGIRTAVDKPVCMVVDDQTERTPFDVSIVNYHKYKSSLQPWVLESEVERLAKHVLAASKAEPRNELWRYFGLTTHAKFDEKIPGTQAQLELLNRRLDQMARMLPSGGNPHSMDDEPTRGARTYGVLRDLLKDMGFSVAKGYWSDSVMTIVVEREVPPSVLLKLQTMAARNHYLLRVTRDPEGGDPRSDITGAPPPG